MSESLIVRFSTKGLDAAKNTLKEIQKRIGAAAKGIEDAGRRKQFLATAKELINERKGEIKSLLDRQRKRNLVADSAADYDAARAESDKAFRTLAQIRAKGAAIAGALSGGGSLQGAVGVLGEGIPGLMNGLGPVAVVVGQVLGLVIPILEKESAAREQRLVKLIERQTEATLKRADVAKRYQDDPRFRQEQSQIARDIVLKRQLAGTAFEPRGARLLGVL